MMVTVPPVALVLVFVFGASSVEIVLDESDVIVTFGVAAWSSRMRPSSSMERKSVVRLRMSASWAGVKKALKPWK